MSSLAAGSGTPTVLHASGNVEAVGMSRQSGDAANFNRAAIRRIHFWLLLTAALLASVVFAASTTKPEEAQSYDGLEKITVKGIDLAYARPGATLAGYDRVLIDPIEASFRKDWDPQKMGSALMPTTRERDNIRNGVAKIVYEELVRELQTKSSYQVVDAAGPTVLRVKATVMNLYVNATDTLHADRSGTYTVAAGEMMLTEELYDSETGQLLARVMDRSASLDSKVMTVNSGIFNIAESRI